MLLLLLYFCALLCCVVLCCAVLLCCLYCVVPWCGVVWCRTSLQENQPTPPHTHTWQEKQEHLEQEQDLSASLRVKSEEVSKVLAALREERAERERVLADNQELRRKLEVLSEELRIARNDAKYGKVGAGVDWPAWWGDGQGWGLGFRRGRAGVTRGAPSN